MNRSDGGREGIEGLRNFTVDRCVWKHALHDTNIFCRSGFHTRRNNYGNAYDSIKEFFKLFSFSTSFSYETSFSIKLFAPKRYASMMSVDNCWSCLVGCDKVGF